MSRDSPLVSVLTPVYNGAAYIEECVASVLRQTYSNWSYTVVDNCSTDATPELVEQQAVHAYENRRYRAKLLLRPEDVAHVVMAALCAPVGCEVTDVRVRPMSKLPSR